MGTVINLLRCLLALLVAVGAMAAQPGQAAQHVVEVVDAHPAGTHVRLAAGEKFYLRIAYATDSMTRIFARPYRHGSEVAALNSPSSRYEGSGETVVWFSFIDAEDSADEIRLFVGNSKRRLGAVHKVFVTGGGRSAGQVPDWVGELETAVIEATGGPQPLPEVEDERWLARFMLVVVGLTLFALFVPLWAFLRWQGRWKIAAAIPLLGIVLLLVLLSLLALFDPGALNLLPLVVLLGALPASLFMVVLLLVRRLTRRRRRERA